MPYCITHRVKKSKEPAFLYKSIKKLVYINGILANRRSRLGIINVLSPSTVLSEVSAVVVLSQGKRESGISFLVMKIQENIATALVRGGNCSRSCLSPFLKDRIYFSPLRCSLFSYLMALSERYQLATVL